MNSPQDLNDFVSDEFLCQNLNAAVRELIHTKSERQSWVDYLQIVVRYWFQITFEVI